MNHNLAYHMGTIILKVTELLMLIGAIVPAFFSHFGLSIDLRYSRYILTYDAMPVFGLDLSFTLSNSPIFVNSPFGWS